jgi:hypothetical protein
MSRSSEQMIYTTIVDKETETEQALIRADKQRGYPPRTPISRSRKGTHPNRTSTERNMITPMRSRVTPSKPPVRTAEPLSGCRKVQEAKASNRKVTEIHNRLDREYPTRKGADVDLVSHPRNEVTVTHRGKS